MGVRTPYTMPYKIIIPSVHRSMKICFKGNSVIEY